MAYVFRHLTDQDIERAFAAIQGTPIEHLIGARSSYWGQPNRRLAGAFDCETDDFLWLIPSRRDDASRYHVFVRDDGVIYICSTAYYKFTIFYISVRLYRTFAGVEPVLSKALRLSGEHLNGDLSNFDRPIALQYVAPFGEELQFCADGGLANMCLRGDTGIIYDMVMRYA